jgi:hypothetical protein
VSDVVAAFAGQEQVEGDRDEGADLVERARPDGAEKRLQFGKRELDRVEVGTIGRQEPDAGADRFDRRPDSGLFMRGQIIEHDDVAAAECGHEDLFDIGEKRLVVDGPIKDGRRAEPVDAQGRDHCRRLPMTAGRVIVEARAARTPTVAPQQVRRHATLVEEHVVPGVVQRLRVAPPPTLRRYVSASLFGGVYGFF